MLVDVILVNTSYVVAVLLYANYNWSNVTFINMFRYFAVVSVVIILVFSIFSLYNSIWMYAGIQELIRILGANILSFIMVTSFFSIVGSGIPLNIHIIAWVFMFFFSGFSRFSFRLFSFYDSKRIKMTGAPKRVLIIGAGRAGALCLRDMKVNVGLGYLPVALIDDNVSKHGSYISGVKVIGGRESIGPVVKSMNINLILLAIANVDPESKKDILNVCKKTGCEVKIMPNIVNLLSDKVGLENLREVNLEDLLGRNPVSLDREMTEKYIKGKVVLVTGGAGSIGSQLCRDILGHRPKELIILDISENSVFNLEHELNNLRSGIKISYVIASIRDKRKMELVFAKYSPELVFHAAALKHVPLMEQNPAEAIKTNVLGTIKLAQVADAYGVGKFVMISSDKAVNPVNVMGATKRICEIYLTALDGRSKTEFVAVRFGNVLGSAGSVVPLFLDQIRAGGPVTITNKDMTRFFMTIPEASQLVLEAGAYAKGGEVFILDMGSPVKIYDLAYDLIWLSGLRPFKDIEIKVTGLRPGEKLYEETLLEEEGLSMTANDKIFVTRPVKYDFDELSIKVEGFIPLLEYEESELIIQQIESLVCSYCRFEDVEVAEEVVS